MSALGVALSRLGSVCLLPVGAGSHVKCVTILRLPDGVSHGGKDVEQQEDVPAIA